MSFSGDPVHAINSQFAIADGSPCIGMAHLRPAGGCPVAKIPIVRENRPALRGRRRPKMDGLTGFRRVGNVQRDRWSRGRQGSIDNLDQPYRVRRLGTNGGRFPFRWLPALLLQERNKLNRKAPAEGQSCEPQEGPTAAL